MSAVSVSEYLFEAKPLWTGQIGSGGVADDTVQTIPLQSVTNLDSGDAYVVTINRVDANGTKTSNPTANTEVIIGELSGSNLINSTRGQEGTAQAWDAGTVVEILFTATHWNKLITFLEVEHDADGTHLATKVVKMTGDQTVAGVKTFTSPVINTGVSGTAIKDEDDFASDSATALATQQSIKAYVDASVPAPRTTTETSSATPTINTDNTDIHTITALAADITSMTTNLSGTPVNGQKLIIRIKDNGTAQAITWGASFVSRGATLPTTTVLSKYLYVGLIYNSTASVWDCVAVSYES